MASLLRTLLPSSRAFSSSPRGYSTLPTSSQEAHEEEELYRISSSPLDTKPLPPTPRQISWLRLFLCVILWVLAVAMFFVVAAGVFTFLRAFGRNGGDEQQEEDGVGDGGDRGFWGLR